MVLDVVDLDQIWVYPYNSKDIFYYRQISVIQIKICAEYRDMLPRPRLVCQEPGLRPIGRSPGVPDKSSRGKIVFGRSPGRRMWTIITSMSTSWRRACTGKKQQSAKVVWHHMAQQSWGINSYLFIYLLKQGFVILSVMTPYGNILFIGRTENCCRGDFCSWRPYGIRHQKPPCVFLNPPPPHPHMSLMDFIHPSFCVFLVFVLHCVFSCLNLFNVRYSSGSGMVVDIHLAYWRAPSDWRRLDIVPNFLMGWMTSRRLPDGLHAICQWKRR